MPRALQIFFAMALSWDLSSKPLDLSSDDAARCESLGRVTGQSGYGKNPNWHAIARTYAELRAEKLGATHVIQRLQREIGTFNGEVTLEAFRCSLP